MINKVVRIKTAGPAAHNKPLSCGGPEIRTILKKMVCKSYGTDFLRSVITFSQKHFENFQV